VQVETGELLLDLRRSQQELKYAVKVKATDGHQAKSITESLTLTLSTSWMQARLGTIVCKFGGDTVMFVVEEAIFV